MLESMNLQNTLYLVDVSLDTGHVLVHYLFTGTYQSLKHKNSPFGEKMAAEFVTSVRVYTAAQNYTLPPLVELAKGEIERLGKGLQASLLFDLVRDAYPSPGTDDIWFNSYLKAQLKLFLESSPKPLAGEITGERNTMSISDILFRNILELFHENTALLHEKQKEDPSQTSMNTVCLGLTPESPKEPTDAGSKKEDKIQKDTVLGKADFFDSLGVENTDKIKSDETQPFSEIHLEVDAAQGIGASDGKKNAANQGGVGASKEKEKKKEKSKKNKKNNGKSLAAVNPPTGPSEDYLLVKSEQNTKDESSMGLMNDNLWEPISLRKGKERITRSGAKVAVPVSSDGDLTAEHKQEAKAKSNKVLEEEGWSFWGLGKENRKRREILDVQCPPPPPLPLCSPKEPAIPTDDRPSW
jgi:hypothetical protein